MDAELLARTNLPLHHIATRHDSGSFGAGLFSFHSQLLRESLLVSFPPLTNMLKFSGCSRLIRGRGLKSHGAQSGNFGLAVTPQARRAPQISHRARAGDVPRGTCRRGKAVSDKLPDGTNGPLTTRALTPRREQARTRPHSRSDSCVHDAAQRDPGSEASILDSRRGAGGRATRPPSGCATTSTRIAARNLHLRARNLLEVRRPETGSASAGLARAARVGTKNRKNFIYHDPRTDVAPE